MGFLSGVWNFFTGPSYTPAVQPRMTSNFLAPPSGGGDVTDIFAIIGCFMGLGGASAAPREPVKALQGKVTACKKHKPHYCAPLPKSDRPHGCTRDHGDAIRCKPHDPEKFNYQSHNEEWHKWLDSQPNAGIHVCPPTNFPKEGERPIRIPHPNPAVNRDLRGNATSLCIIC